MHDFTRKCGKKTRCFNYTDSEVAPKRYRDPFHCNWRLIRRIKHGHMFHFDAKITQANGFSAFDERFLRRTYIMNITLQIFYGFGITLRAFQITYEEIELRYVAVSSNLLHSLFICGQILPAVIQFLCGTYEHITNLNNRAFFR